MKTYQLYETKPSIKLSIRLWSKICHLTFVSHSNNSFKNKNIYLQNYSLTNDLLGRVIISVLVKYYSFNNELILRNNIFAIILNHLLSFIRKLVDSSDFKISKFPAQKFLQTFSPDLPKDFFPCHSEHYAENEKDGNRLVQNPVNIVYQSKSNIFPV